MSRPLPASFFKRPEAKCLLKIAKCRCRNGDGCNCRYARRESDLCENQLMPWMLEYNKKAPAHQRLPYEIWFMILDKVRDRANLAARARVLVRSSRFSDDGDFFALLRLYAVVNELEYFLHHVNI